MTTTMTLTRTSGGLTSLFRRDPLRALRREVDDVLSHFAESWDGDWLPAGRLSAAALNLSETNGELQITMELPGVKPDEIDIQITGNTIRISGEHKEEKEEKGKTFHRIERRAGAFSRSVELPCAVKEEGVTAEDKDGVLTITLPKTEEAKTHKVKVKG